MAKTKRSELLAQLNEIRANVARLHPDNPLAISMGLRYREIERQLKPVK